MGGSAGRAGAVLRQMLTEKGVNLSLFDTVKMPDNCIYLYNPFRVKRKRIYRRDSEKSRSGYCNDSGKNKGQGHGAFSQQKSIGLVTYLRGRFIF